MSALDSLFAKDVLLDEDAFESASRHFIGLSRDLNSLESDITRLLDELYTGFDTPAGRKFINSCRGNLLQPMRDLSAVINHISDNLIQARSKYKSVFDEFKKLNSIINDDY